MSISKDIKKVNNKETQKMTKDQSFVKYLEFSKKVKMAGATKKKEFTIPLSDTIRHGLLRTSL